MLEIVLGVLALIAGDAAARPSEPPVVVTGACACPTPADVQAQLVALASERLAAPPTKGTAPEPHDAVLTCPGDGTVEVVLRSASRERLADRALAAQGSCADLASAIAVIIGAWEADLDPRVSSSVELPAPAPVAPSPPAPRPVDREEPGVAVAPASPPGAPRFSFGVGLLAALTGGQITPGATIEGDVLPASGHLGAAAAITATTARDSSFGGLSNVAHWSRVTLGLGPGARFNLGATRIDLHAQAVAAVLSVGGNGLPTTSSDTSLQLGGAAALRTAWAWGTSAIWVGAQVLGFPGDDRLIVNGLTTQGKLPHIELQLASGLSLGRFP